ncbi:peptide-methionine (S)-S-oxide reductase [Pullulanibacillus pueri]|uniref:Peptide methionine sulfoxide reductase MsrA n=2 Tax=Pullulanibacillus pueri TaxID=1437324 RepID=A0A8J2ZW09_9BACL|nr:peptide-methionine (S)-S-oxide reductase [Pullulanibacillus pueri]GGH82700.1 peptide methionine sulfoxide reductase MsrA [Pullulanibacillus pueri]
MGRFIDNSETIYKPNANMEVIYLAGGCLWGVQAFIKTLPGVRFTEAGRANGTSHTLEGDYDGYAECVKTGFDPTVVTIRELMGYLFEIIDPYSLNKQGEDVGEKYRTGVYSENPEHLKEAKAFLSERRDYDRIVVEVLPLINYVRSAEEHQDRLARCPNDYCHIPEELLSRYR